MAQIPINIHMRKLSRFRELQTSKQTNDKGLEQKRS